MKMNKTKVTLHSNAQNTRQDKKQKKKQQKLIKENIVQMTQKESHLQLHTAQISDLQAKCATHYLIEATTP